MKAKYIDITGQNLTLYDAEGYVCRQFSGIEGSLCGQGKDFFVIENNEYYKVYNYMGTVLHCYSKSEARLVSVESRGLTFIENGKLRTYDRNGIETNAVDIKTAARHETMLHKLSKYGNAFITSLIILNALAAGAMTYLADDSSMELWLNRFCDISIVIFVIEIIVKIAVFKKEYFKGEDAGWNIFDVIVTVISSLSFFTGLEGLVGARAIRILRELRLLRVISGSSNMKRIFNALLFALPQISWASLFFVLLYYIYGIIGVELFGGCCESFANLHRTFLTLMQIMTFDDWMALTSEVMEAHPWAWIYFVTFVILAAYILVNLLVGIVVDSLNEVREQEDLDKNDISREFSKLEKQIENVKKLMKKEEGKTE